MAGSHEEAKGRPQERKECGRCEELQEGPMVVAGGERSRGDAAGPRSLMEGLTGFLRIWDFIPRAVGSQCRVLNGSTKSVFGHSLHFNKNMGDSVGTRLARGRSSAGDYLENYCRPLV